MRIGLVLFAGESFKRCPITTDHKILVQLFDDVESGMLKGGTAIDEGIGTAISGLIESKSKSIFSDVQGSFDFVQTNFSGVNIFAYETENTSTQITPN